MALAQAQASYVAGSPVPLPLPPGPPVWLATHANNTLSLRKTPLRARGVERAAPIEVSTPAAAPAPAPAAPAPAPAAPPPAPAAPAPVPAASAPAVGDRVILILDNVEGVVTARSRPGWFMVDLDGYDSAIEFRASELCVLSPALDAATAAPAPAPRPVAEAPAAAAATPAPPTVAPSTRIVRGTGDASAPLELASSDDEAARETPAARPADSVGERRARVLRVFEHAVICGGRCGKPACATMKNHIQHRNETSGQCRCTTCRGIETCVVLHARRCRSPTCPISACARRRLQDAQAAAAGRLQDAQALLPPPAGRWEYRCSKCGQPKKGHVCPYD